eukprot:scaffold47165_cov88-Phaeocystis_antarctica.AAC.2
MRLRAGLPAGPYLAGVQGCVPRGSPSSERLRICAFRAAYSALRCKAAAQAARCRVMRLRVGLPAGPHLGGMRGCVPRGSPSSRRLRLGPPACLSRAAMRGCCPGSLPPHDAASGRPTGWPLPCWSARLRAKRLAKFGAA